MTRRLLQIVTLLQMSAFLLPVLIGTMGCGEPNIETSALAEGFNPRQYTVLSGASQKGHVDYFLVWNRDGLRRTANQDIEFDTNLGFTVRISNAWLANYQVSLAACESLTSRRPWSWFIAQAKANDGNAVDLSATAGGLVEDVSKTLDQHWSRRPLQEHGYCSLHHLLARADETTGHRPADHSLDRKTLLISGEASKDGVPFPFRLTSAYAHGRLEQLLPLSYGSEPLSIDGDSGLKVVIERHIARWFDGLDFSQLNEQELSYLVGASIQSTTKYFVIVAPN